MDKDIMKKLTNEGYESLTMEEIDFIIETTNIRFDIHDGRVARMRYER